MINVLITGAGGQLAKCIIDVLNKNADTIKYTAYTRNELSITDKSKLSNILKKTHYDYLINCAAYTDVPGAEQNEEQSLLVNSYGPKILAECCSENNVKLIHFSTDYVFSGSLFPLEVDEAPNPLNRYGRTKLLGETEITNIADKTKDTDNELQYMIIRISWLYSEYGKNFVKTILRKLKKNEELKVVYDQVGSPTYAGDVAAFLVHDVILSNTEFKSGIYHYTNYGSISWYDFAYAICEIYDKITYEINNEIKFASHIIYPISTDSLGAGVERPRVAMLSKENLTKTYNTKIPYWKDSLYNVIKKLVIYGDAEFNVR